MADEENQWYILIGQERQGPMSTHDVRYLLTRRRIDGGTLVWKEGMDSWIRLREIEEFHPRKKKAEEPEAAPEEKEEKAPPPPSAPSPTTRLLQRVIPALLTLGLVGGAVYVYVTGDPGEEETAPAAASRVKRENRSPQQLVEALKQGERGAKQQLVRSGGRAVPALIQALAEKGSPLNPKEVGTILIEIGPSSASAIGDALENLKLSKAARIILVEVLGEFGGLTSVPALIIALGHPDPDVQERAIDAIAKLDPAFGPALARNLNSPVRELSKQQKQNLATALGRHGSPAAIPGIQQASRAERDAEVIASLARAVEQITRNPRTSDPVPPVAAAARPEKSNNGGGSAQAPPQKISVHVSASATATATAESPDDEDDADEPAPDKSAEEQAEALAEEGRKLREAGREEEALEKYRQAYALVPLRAYLLIIIALEDEGAPADSTSGEPPADLPEIEAPRQIALSEIYEEMDTPEPDLSEFSGGLGTWSGVIESREPVSRDGRRDLFVVRGSGGQDFVAAVRRREVTDADIGATRAWKGTLQGFRIVPDGSDNRMLPVLLVD